MTVKPLPLEARIQRDIEAALGSEQDLYLMRNSEGRAVYYSKDGKRYFVPYGLEVGSPDLVGMLRAPMRHGPNAEWLSYWFCLEIKRPGEELSEDQVKCHARWRARGALVYTVTSVEEARKALEDARGRIAPARGRIAP